MAENFENTVGALMSSLENYVSTKTIVGEPIQYCCVPDGRCFFWRCCRGIQ